MLHLKKMLAVTGAGLFVLASCWPSKPGPTITATATSTPAYTLTNTFVLSLTGRANRYSSAERDTACEDIIPFDGGQAYKHAIDPSTGQVPPIMWTFGVNFRVQSSQGEPVGCFKLYEVDTTGPTPEYIPINVNHRIDYSYLVDSCTLAGAHPVSISSGEATFDGTGYIECAMNLADWVSQIASLIPTTDPLNSLLKIFYSSQFQPYQSFTMVAQASLPASIPNPLPTDLPLMVYDARPQGSQPATPPFDRPVLALTPLDNTKVSFGNCPPQGPNLILGPGLLKDYYWWYDLQATANQHFVYIPQLTGTTATDCGPGKENSPLTFWIGEAALEIGYDTGNVFQGIIDGVLIDPGDSKPPE